MAGWGRRFRIALQGEDPRSGRNFIWHMFHARPGGGARRRATAFVDRRVAFGRRHQVRQRRGGGGALSAPFRPPRVPPGSGGDGSFRGGLGVDLDLVVETQTTVRGNTAATARATAPAACSAGRRRAAPLPLVSGDRPPRVLKTKEIGIAIEPGDRLELRSGGGGGWGPPSDRDRARKRDVT
jgi:N-methylhydantoinase B